MSGNAKFRWFLLAPIVLALLVVTSSISWAGELEDALKHFQMASKVDSSVGESHYNEALCLDKLGKHGEATNHFYAARKYAKGNPAILGSKILNAHSPVKMEGS